MPYLGTNELKRILPTLIDKYQESRLKNASYELALGSQVFLTDSEPQKRTTLNSTNQPVEIRPGQFALLLTDEIIEIPLDKIGFISVKFTEKIKGLINVSGFHVDPGFKGKLIFSVYNAGPNSIMMDQGTPYFLLWIADLSEKAEEYHGKHQGQNEIPARLIEQLQGSLASPNAIVKKIDELENSINNSIKDVERKKIRNEYLMTLIIGLLVTIGIKLYWDSRAEELGYQKRLIEEKQIKAVAIIQNSDSLTLKLVDSLLNQKLRQKIEQPK